MASAVTVLPAMKEGMKRSERKLHPRNGPTQLAHPPTWVCKRPFAPTCKGLDAGVTGLRHKPRHKFLSPGLLASVLTGGHFLGDGTRGSEKLEILIKPRLSMI